MKTDAITLRFSACHTLWMSTLSMLTVMALVGISSCKDDDTGPRTSGCRVVLQTNTVSGRESETVTYTYLSKFGRSYDDKGNETENTTLYDYTYSDGTTASYSGSNSKQYDDEGFLVRMVNQSSRTERDKSTNFSNSSTQHTYENGRLIKSTSESTYNGGDKRTESYLYEYNSDGNLTKFTNVSGNEVTTIDYTGKKISKVTRVDAKGVSTSPFFEYNSKRLLVKWIETHETHTEEYRYEYDDKGQVARRERWINGKTNSADAIEYDTRHSPYETESPLPKGHPDVPSLYPLAVTKNNVSRGMYYDGNAAGTGWDIRASTVAAYDYNARGFPVSSTSNSFDKAGVETSSASSVYEYEGCP